MFFEISASFDCVGRGFAKIGHNLTPLLMSNSLKNWWQRRKKLQVLRQVAKSEAKFYASIPRIVRVTAIDGFLREEIKTNKRVKKLHDQAEAVEEKFGKKVAAKADFIDDSFKIVEMRMKREEPSKWKRFFKGWRRR